MRVPVHSNFRLEVRERYSWIDVSTYRWKTDETPQNIDKSSLDLLWEAVTVDVTSSVQIESASPRSESVSRVLETEQITSNLSKQWGLESKKQGLVNVRTLEAKKCRWGGSWKGVLGAFCRWTLCAHASESRVNFEPNRFFRRRCTFPVGSSSHDFLPFTRATGRENKYTGF